LRNRLGRPISCTGRGGRERNCSCPEQISEVEGLGLVICWGARPARGVAGKRVKNPGGSDGRKNVYKDIPSRTAWVGTQTMGEVGGEANLSKHQEYGFRRTRDEEENMDQEKCSRGANEPTDKIQLGVFPI